MLLARLGVTQAFARFLGDASDGVHLVNLGVDLPTSQFGGGELDLLYRLGGHDQW